jgi:hypothetical protein
MSSGEQLFSISLFIFGGILVDHCSVSFSAILLIFYKVLIVMTKCEFYEQNKIKVVTGFDMYVPVMLCHHPDYKLKKMTTCKGDIKKCLVENKDFLKDIS